MNSHLIEKVIKSSNESCPEFIYSNPLLDRNVARALSKSFIKIMDASKQNMNLNNNLRLSVLTNIRKMCQIEPDNHLKVDENLTNSLTECYLQQINERSTISTNSVDKNLETFLMRRLKELNFSSSFGISINGEVIQALINLNENVTHLDILSKDVLNWKISGNNITVLKDLWLHDNLQTEHLFGDISIKIKSEIEILLLNVCCSILENRNISINEIFSINDSLNNLVQKCSVSPCCFQICCDILNSLFSKTNFDPRLHIFITTFVRKIKSYCLDANLSPLYPVQFNHIVILLDFDLNLLSQILKSKYIEAAVKYLCQVHRNSENDLILLLSHFPQWFDIYAEHQKLISIMS